MMLFTTIVLLCLSTIHESEEKTPLHFFYMTTKTGFFRASGAIPVVDMALEQINNRTDILSDYSLSYTTVLDSKVNLFRCNSLISCGTILKC